MEEEKYQKELFEFAKRKRLFPRLFDLLPKADFERNVILTLTLDRAVFIAIGIIMVMVVVYALGVEAGKPRIDSGVQPVIAAQAPAVRQDQPVRVAAPVPVPAVSNAIKPYTIVAATFTRRDTAMQEVDKLKRQGYGAAIMQSDRYFQVCIGAYKDKAGAESQGDLKKVKRLYKDAYLKLK